MMQKAMLKIHIFSLLILAHEKIDEHPHNSDLQKKENHDELEKRSVSLLNSIDDLYRLAGK